MYFYLYVPVTKPNRTNLREEGLVGGISVCHSGEGLEGQGVKLSLWQFMCEVEASHVTVTQEAECRGGTGIGGPFQKSTLLSTSAHLLESMRLTGK